MAFRTKEALKSIMRDALTSNLWNKIKDSLIGSELIAYAAEFLYQDERISDNLVGGVYPTADSSLQQLAQAASYSNVAFSKFSPATISIRLKGVEQNAVYEPFSLCLNKGGVNYWNIEYVSSSDVITMYQGKVCCSATNMSIQGKFNASTTSLLSINRDYDNTMNYSLYATLSYNAYVDSVKCYALTSSGRWDIYDIYRPITSSPDTKNYKLIWNNDMYLDIYFGNGLWGKTYDMDNYYFIYYLEASKSSIELTNLKLSYNSENIEYDVLSYKEYDESNASAFNSLNASMNKNAVIATKKEIESFSNTFPYVESSVAKNTGLNQVTVFVQPSKEFLEKHADGYGKIDNTILNDLVENLQTYGEIVVEYKAQLASEVRISVRVTILDYLGDTVFPSVKSQIQDYINKKFEGLQLGESIDFSNLSSELFSEFKVRSIVALDVRKEKIGEDLALSYQPNVQTVKLHSRNSNYYIDRGNIYKKKSSMFDFGPSSFSIGDFLVLGKVNQKSFICDLNEDEILGKDADLLIIEDDDYAMKFNRVTYGSSLSVFGVRFKELKGSTSDNINEVHEFSSFAFSDKALSPSIYSSNETNIFSNNSLGMSFDKSKNPSSGESDFNPYYGKYSIAYAKSPFISRSMYYNKHLYVFDNGTIVRYKTNNLYLDSRDEIIIEDLNIDNSNFLGMYVNGDDLIVLGENNGFSYYISNFESSHSAENVSISGIQELRSLSLDYYGGARSNDDIVMIPYFGNNAYPYLNYMCHSVPEISTGSTTGEVTIYKSPNAKCIHFDLFIPPTPYYEVIYVESNKTDIIPEGTYRTSADGRYMHFKVDASYDSFQIYLRKTQGQTSSTVYKVSVTVKTTPNVSYKYILSEKPTYDASISQVSFKKINELDLSSFLSDGENGEVDGYSASYVTPIRYIREEGSNSLYMLQVNPTSECASRVILAKWTNENLTPQYSVIDYNSNDGIDFYSLDNVGYFRKNGSISFTSKKEADAFKDVDVDYQASSTYFAVNQESYLRLEEGGVYVEKNS